MLKRCREEGLLKDNLIAVRVRTQKSASETARYTVENCALEAKLIREHSKQKEDHEENGKVVPAAEGDKSSSTGTTSEDGVTRTTTTE